VRKAKQQKIGLNPSDEPDRQIWVSDSTKTNAGVNLPELLKTNEQTKGEKEWTGMYAQSVGMFMIQNRVIRTMASPPEPSGKMCRMIGNARYAVLPRLTLKKSNPFTVT
jgi:hypothetical protein